jgi:hypothetical protein
MEPQTLRPAGPARRPRPFPPAANGLLPAPSALVSPRHCRDSCSADSTLISSQSGDYRLAHAPSSLRLPTPTRRSWIVDAPRCRHCCFLRLQLLQFFIEFRYFFPRRFFYRSSTCAVGPARCTFPLASRTYSAQMLCRGRS